MPGPLRFAVPFLLLIVPAPAVAQDAAAVEFFEKKVRPILAEHCLKCHGEPGVKVRGKLKLTSRADLLTGGASGPAVAPGDPAKSLLIQLVKHSGDIKMPPENKLGDRQIADLTRWVKDGAVWPATGSADNSAKPGAPLFTDEQRKFWAFQPVRALGGAGSPESESGHPQ